MKADLVLFHVSDLHFGYEDRAALDWFMAEVEREAPAAVLCTGDLTMRGTAREFALAKEWLRQIPAPVLLEPGNHDVPYYWYPIARTFHPWRLYSALRRELTSDAKLDDVTVVSLGTVAAAQWRLNWSKGRVKLAELDRALAELERHRPAGLKLVTCHHPLVDADTQSTGSTRGGKRALAALARAGADAVLSGHVHDAFDLTVDAGGQPIRLIGAGTLSKRLRSTPPGYNRLEWSPESGLQVIHRSMD